MPRVFDRLQIVNWRQFRTVDIDFHDRLTVLTGANGAGKTTLLNILSRHFGWQGTMVSTPLRRGATAKFSAGRWTDDELKEFVRWLEEQELGADGRSELDQDNTAPPTPAPAEQDIGGLRYGDGSEVRLSVPTTVGASFQVNIRGQRQQLGMHVPSHRPIFSYQSVENIPTVPRRRADAYNSYLDIVRTRFYGGHHQRTPNYYMKETLIALASFGYGNEIIERDQESLDTFNGFQNVLSMVLPRSLGFRRLVVRLPEVVLVTRSGDFSLDAVSGGIASLVDLAWQVYMYAKPDTTFAVTIDEPENHLHPELQRTVLPTLLQAFPHIQFVCATHNPFVVTSVPDSHVYALRYGPDHRVFSEFLSSADRSGTSNEVLRDVLGLPSSSPTWVEAELDNIQESLVERDLTPALLNELRARLTDSGLERFVPSILAKLAEQQLADDQAKS